MGGTFLFALKSIFIKLAYAAGTDAETLLALRMLIALPFYAGMLAYLQARGTLGGPLPGTKVLRILMYGFLGYYLASILDLWGLELISAQLERLTLFSYPTMIAVLAWLFLGERLTGRILSSLALSYLGIWVMFSQETQLTGTAQTLTGVLLVLGAALSFSVYVILAKPLIESLGSRTFTSLAMLGSTLFVLAHFATVRPLSALAVSAEIWGYAFLLAFVSTVVPSFMVSEAIARIGPTRTTIFGSVGPVFTLFLAVVWLGEPSSLAHWLGTLLVIVGVTLVSRK